MKTKYMLGAAIVVALNCVTANAQILGGNVGGGLGGALNGGLGGTRDIGVMGQGSGYGSLGTDLDTGSLHRTTRDAAGRTTDRSRGVVGGTRARTRSVEGAVRDTSEYVAATRDHAATTTATVRGSAEASTSAAVDVTQGAAATAQQLEGAASAASSMASSLKVDGNSAEGALDAAHAQPLTAMAAQPSDHSATNSLAGQAMSKADDAKVAAPEMSQVETPKSEPGHAKRPLMDGALSKGVSTNASSDDERMPLAATTDSSADGQASASKRRVSANGSVQGSGSAALNQ